MAVVTNADPHAPLDPDWVELAIPPERVACMLAEGRLCLADIHCLNHRSKRCLWHLLLQLSQRQDDG